MQGSACTLKQEKEPANIAAVAQNHAGTLTMDNGFYILFLYALELQTAQRFVA